MWKTSWKINGRQEWKSNVKEGNGRHTFDDGKVYDGYGPQLKRRETTMSEMPWHFLLRKFEADRMVDYCMAPRCFGLLFFVNQNAAMEVSLNFPKKKILSVASALVSGRWLWIWRCQLEKSGVLPLMWVRVREALGLFFGTLDRNKATATNLPVFLPKKTSKLRLYRHFRPGGHSEARPCAAKVVFFLGTWLSKWFFVFLVCIWSCLKIGGRNSVSPPNSAINLFLWIQVMKPPKPGRESKPLWDQYTWASLKGLQIGLVWSRHLLLVTWIEKDGRINRFVGNIRELVCELILLMTEIRLTSWGW